MAGGVDAFTATLSSNVRIGSVAVVLGHASNNASSSTVGMSAGVLGMSSILSTVKVTG